MFLDVGLCCSDKTETNPCIVVLRIHSREADETRSFKERKGKTQKTLNCKQFYQYIPQGLQIDNLV